MNTNTRNLLPASLALAAFSAAFTGCGGVEDAPPQISLTFVTPGLPSVSNSTVTVTSSVTVNVQVVVTSTTTEAGVEEEDPCSVDLLVTGEIRRHEVRPLDSFDHYVTTVANCGDKVIRSMELSMTAEMATGTIRVTLFDDDANVGITARPPVTTGSRAAVTFNGLSSGAPEGQLRRYRLEFQTNRDLPPGRNQVCLSTILAEKAEDRSPAAIRLINQCFDIEVPGPVCDVDLTVIGAGVFHEQVTPRRHFLTHFIASPTCGDGSDIDFFGFEMDEQVAIGIDQVRFFINGVEIDRAVPRVSGGGRAFIDFRRSGREISVVEGQPQWFEIMFDTNSNFPVGLWPICIPDDGVTAVRADGTTANVELYAQCVLIDMYN